MYKFATRYCQSRCLNVGAVAGPYFLTLRMSMLRVNILVTVSEGVHSIILYVSLVIEGAQADFLGLSRVDLVLVVTKLGYGVLHLSSFEEGLFVVLMADLLFHNGLVDPFRPLFL